MQFEQQEEWIHTSAVKSVTVSIYTVFFHSDSVVKTALPTLTVILTEDEVYNHRHPLCRSAGRSCGNTILDTFCRVCMSFTVTETASLSVLLSGGNSLRNMPPPSIMNEPYPPSPPPSPLTSTPPHPTLALQLHVKVKVQSF